METVEFKAPKAEVWSQTTELRFLDNGDYRAGFPRLQQAWRSMSTGALRWEDVPIVVAENRPNTPGETE